jgi:hypothetical protein
LVVREPAAGRDEARTTLVDVLLGATADAGSIPAASTFGSTVRVSRRSPLGNDCDFVILDSLEQRFRKLLDVPVGVDVARRRDRLVAEELLDGLEIPGRVENALTSVWRALCIRSPEVTPSETTPARCRHPYHQLCKPWTPIGFSGYRRVSIP